MSWESISLSDALRPLKSSPFTRDELNYSGGQYQNVHYGDILVRFPSVVDAEKEGLPYVSDSAEGRCSRCSLLQNGDIIIADTAEDEAVGKAIEIQGITDQKVVSGLHTMAFRPQEGLFAPGFLGYFLNSSVYHNQLFPLMQGIKVLSISKTAIGDTVIKYPSYKEQEKIVESLSGVDDIIGALDEAIAKKRQIKEGLMRRLLTPQTGSKWVERLGRELFSIGNGRDYKSLGSGSIPVYGTGGLMASVDDYLYDGPTVCIGRKGTIDRPQFHEGKIWTVDTLFYTYDFKGVNPKFLYYLFCRVNWHALNEATGVPSLTSNNILNVCFLLPSEEEEQRSIVTILDAVEDEIVALDNKRQKYSLIKKGMMQELLTGKTRLI